MPPKSTNIALLQIDAPPEYLDIVPVLLKRAHGNLIIPHHCVIARWRKEDGAKILLGLPCERRAVAEAYVLQLRKAGKGSVVRATQATLIKVL